jgi:hypothetical protein
MEGCSGNLLYTIDFALNESRKAALSGRHTRLHGQGEVVHTSSNKGRAEGGGRWLKNPRTLEGVGIGAFEGFACGLSHGELHPVSRTDSDPVCLACPRHLFVLGVE